MLNKIIGKLLEASAYAWLLVFVLVILGNTLVLSGTEAHVYKSPSIARRAEAQY